MPIGYNEYKLNPNVTKESFQQLVKGIDDDIKDQKQYIQKLEAEIKNKQSGPQANHSAVKYTIESDKRYLQHSKNQLKDLERQKQAAESQYQKSQGGR